MRVLRFLSIAVPFCALTAASAQENPKAAPSGSSTAPGVSAAWQVQQTMQGLADSARKLEPVLNEAKPERWSVNGAPDSYIQQLKVAQANVAALIAATDKLAHDPEKMTAALEAYFRMEGVEAILGSVRDGIRKYQNPELATQLTRLMAETSNNRDKLRAHIQDLASTREQEFRVMDQEAQRCRGILVTQPTTAATRNRKSR